MLRLPRAAAGGRGSFVTAALLVGAFSVVVALVHPTTASARIRPGQVHNPLGLFTEVTLTGTATGSSVSGGVAPAGFDPLGGYPSTVPAGSKMLSGVFAGTLAITDPEGRTGLAYCIDLETETEAGVHYVSGVWSEAHVPNLGFVEYILTHYYPAVSGLPAGTTDTTRAAAVQAAIWFFADKFVLPETSTVRPFTAAIVADALANGPAPEPHEPVLDVTPEHLAAPSTGDIVGPFTVTTDGPAAVRSLDGVELFTDPHGTHRLSAGDVVPPGTRLWARSISDTHPQGFVLERTVTQLTGTVYLYDGTNPGFEQAQKLVLAQDKQLLKLGGATFERFAAGRLLVTKHILGAAGLQGHVTIKVTCTGTESAPAQEHVLTFPAGTPGGVHERTISGIPAGSACTLTETSAGSNSDVGLASPPTISPSTVTITAGETASATVTDTYCNRPAPSHTPAPSPTPTGPPIPCGAPATGTADAGILAGPVLLAAGSALLLAGLAAGTFAAARRRRALPAVPGSLGGRRRHRRAGSGR